MQKIIGKSNIHSDVHEMRYCIPFASPIAILEQLPQSACLAAKRVLQYQKKLILGTKKPLLTLQCDKD